MATFLSHLWFMHAVHQAQSPAHSTHTTYEMGFEVSVHHL